MSVRVNDSLYSGLFYIILLLSWLVHVTRSGGRFSSSVPFNLRACGTVERKVFSREANASRSLFAFLQSRRFHVQGVDTPHGCGCMLFCFVFPSSSGEERQGNAPSSLLSLHPSVTSLVHAGVFRMPSVDPHLLRLSLRSSRRRFLIACIGIYADLYGHLRLNIFPHVSTGFRLRTCISPHVPS